MLVFGKTASNLVWTFVLQTPRGDLRVAKSQFIMRQSGSHTQSHRITEVSVKKNKCCYNKQASK